MLQQTGGSGNYVFWKLFNHAAEEALVTGSESTIDWPQVLRSHERWLRTVAFARVRSAEAVDEVMQEVALAVFRNSAPLADTSKLTPWLYRLTVRQSLLYRRRCGRRRKLAHRYAARQPAPPSLDNPLLGMLADERRRLIRVALERLPNREVEILLLKYTEHWSYQQIAMHFGVSASAVQARLHRARHRLREVLVAADLAEATS